MAVKVSFNNKARLMSFGAYPNVTLDQARKYRNDAKRLIANGTDPLDARQTQKQEQENATKNIFENIALEWFDQVKDNLAPKTLSNMHSRIQAEILPFIGKRPIAELTAQDYLGRAYNRTSHLRERKRMMQRWADYLDTLKAGGQFIQFPKQA